MTPWRGALADAPPHRVTRLLLEPPLLDVPVGREGTRIEVAHGLGRDGDPVVGEAEVVRLLVVQDLVEGLVVLLPRRLAAVAIRGGTTVLQGLAEAWSGDRAEVEARRLLRRVGDLARVPDAVRVGLDAKRPADDPALDLLVPVRELVDHGLEGLELWVHLDADALVLLRRDLEQRFADLVARVRDDRELERLAVPGVEPVGPLGVARLLDEVLCLRLVERVLTEGLGVRCGPRDLRVGLDHPRAVPEEDLLDHQVHVEAVRERLAHALVGERRRTRALGVPADVGVPQVLVLVDLQVLLPRDVIKVLRLDRAVVDLARLQLRGENGGVGDDLEDVLVGERGPLPVGVVPLEDDLVALAPLLELEWAAGDRGRCVLRRAVGVLRRIVVDRVLAEDVRRQRPRGRPERVHERRAEGLRELHAELLGIRLVDLDAGDRGRRALARRRADAVVVEALDELVIALADRGLAAGDGLYVGEVVLPGDRLSIGPAGVRVDLPGVGEPVRGDRPFAEVRLHLTRLWVRKIERLVDPPGHVRRRNVVREHGVEGLDAGERPLDDAAALLGRLRRGHGLRASARLARAGRRDDRCDRDTCDEARRRARESVHAPLAPFGVRAGQSLGRHAAARPRPLVARYGSADVLVQTVEGKVGDERFTREERIHQP